MGYVSVPFEQSGLFQSDMVKKAYEMVKDDPRAILSAKLMSDVYPVEDAIAGHLLSFLDREKMSVGQIEQGYNKDVARFVSHIRSVYDDSASFSLQRYSGEIELSFVAVATYDLQALVEQWKDTRLSAALLGQSQEKGKLVLMQTTLERHLRQQRREYEDKFLPIAEGLIMYGSGMEVLISQFKEALRALELKIAQPETPVSSATPRRGSPKL